MLNKELFDNLLQEFGVEKTLIYCEMEAKKYELLQKRCVEMRSVDVCNAFDYEASWWKQQCEQLKSETVC
jgi:hypothetical protein